MKYKDPGTFSNQNFMVHANHLRVVLFLFVAPLKCFTHSSRVYNLVGLDVTVAAFCFAPDLSEPNHRCRGLYPFQGGNHRIDLITGMVRG